ncbi:ABC transporter substrate-binding protein [Opitutaceae bacterium]|nr:ABC transporter substrate-binding protein [Opitutaceae bacterium]
MGLLSALKAEPLRVVSQTVGTDEMLLAVADPEQIVALSHIARERDYSAVAKQAESFPAIARGDAETILKFRPDLVLVADYSRGELVSQLERAGVELMVFDRYATMEDAFANLRRLAQRLGGDAEPRAEAVIADVTTRLGDLRSRLEGVAPVKVIAPSTYGVTSGAGTTFQDMCDHAAADNLATTLGGLEGHAQMPRERMLTWPVEKVVLSGYEAEEAITPFLTLIPFRFMDAVKNRQVALVEPYMFGSVTHYRIDGYERLARQLHPELFSDD